MIHLGESEWRDLEAAVRAALDRGVKRVVLYGTSMGGLVIGRFLDRSSLARTVSAAVLDAPPSDLEAVGARGASRYGLPPAAGWLANRIAEWRTGVDMYRLNLITIPPAVRPPTLLFHGDADEEVPARVARELAAAARRVNWPMRYEEFPGAGHTGAWNADRARYERVLADFLTPFAGR